MNITVNGAEVDAGAWATSQLAAVHELLRQRALATGLLDAGAGEEESARAIEQLLMQEVQVPEPTSAECRRYYDARRDRFRSGELVHARHILFQITPGAPIPAVRALAEAMLKELRQHPELFEERARKNSNCPSAAQGGQLGQLARGATVPEFERVLFADSGTGLLPELVKTRFGFHIVSIDQRITGEQLPFEAVAERVARELRAASEQRALGQYVRVLAGQAELEGVDLDAAASPLVQ